jgi:hypothetical protein
LDSHAVNWLLRAAVDSVRIDERFRELCEKLHQEQFTDDLELRSAMVRTELRKMLEDLKWFEFSLEKSRTNE